MSDYRKKEERNILDTAIPGMMRTVLVILAVLIFVSCASVSLYTIDVKYSPTGKPANPSDVLSKDTVFTVAKFIDQRNVEDKTLIGKVVGSDGKSVNISPKYARPSETVTSAIKDFLMRNGYSVSDETPSWNLSNESLDDKRGEVMIGGTIEKFDITCQKDAIKKNYTSLVKLSMVLANVAEGRIFLKKTVETNPSLVHVSFSEKKLEEQMNTALTDAVNRLLADEKLYIKIEEEIGD